MTSEEIKLQLTLALIEKAKSCETIADAMTINITVNKLYSNIVKENGK